MHTRLGSPAPGVMTPRHLAKRAPMPAYSASRSRRPSRPSVTVSCAWPASGFAPVSTLMPGMMPAPVSAETKDAPVLVFWRMVSSKRIAPLMHAPRPGALTISSRQSRRAPSVWGMFSFAKRLLQVALLSSMASKPLSPATSACAVSINACAVMML
jgi:hypothetical protein